MCDAEPQWMIYIIGKWMDNTDHHTCMIQFMYR